MCLHASHLQEQIHFGKKLHATQILLKGYSSVNLIHVLTHRDTE